MGQDRTLSGSAFSLGCTAETMSFEFLATLISRAYLDSPGTTAGGFDFQTISFFWLTNTTNAKAACSLLPALTEHLWAQEKTENKVILIFYFLCCVNMTENGRGRDVHCGMAIQICSHEIIAAGCQGLWRRLAC